MKLVLRDYIESLKEDGELDDLILELLINLSILPLSKPQRGRQYGVDIAAVGYDPEDKQRKIFLIAVKMGNIDRTTWDSVPTGIRSSLNEIRDTYLKTLIPPIYSDLPIKVVVASNGFIDSNVRINWNSYITENTKPKIAYDYWGIDALTLNVEEYILNSKLFSEETQNLLKKTLIFLEVPDYDLSHFYLLIDNIYSSLDAKKKKINRKNRKLFRAANLCLSIVYRRGKEINNLKPVIYAAERLMLVTWGVLSKHDLINQWYINEYFRILDAKTQIENEYFLKLKDYFFIDEGLSRNTSNHVEYGLIAFEQIGLISNMGLYHIQLCELVSYSTPGDNRADKAFNEHYECAVIIAEGLVNLLIRNPATIFPLLDDHIIEINSVLTLLFLTENKDQAIRWLNAIINSIVYHYKFYKTHPQFVTDYESLFEYHFEGKEQAISSSTLFVLIAEWAIILESHELYKYFSSIVNEYFPSINLQLWFAEKEVEQDYYFKNAALQGSTKHSIKLYENPLEYEAEMTEERILFAEEKEFSYYKNHINYLAFVATRHYRTLPFPNQWRNLLKSRFCFSPKEKSESVETIT